MTRFAEASARAGRALSGDDGRWERERKAAQELLGAKPAVTGGATTMPSPQSAAVLSSPAVQQVPQPIPWPSPVAEPQVVEKRVAHKPSEKLIPARPSHPRQTDELSNAPDLELTSAVRRIFLSSSSSPVRSVLFCTPPGDMMSDAAWQTAEALAYESGRPIAFVEDGSSRGIAPQSSVAADLIARIGWYPPDAKSQAAPRDAYRRGDYEGQDSQATARRLASDDVLGQHVADLFDAFDFVIVNATAPTPGDLVPLAGEVDAVVLLVTDQKTLHESARALASTLRACGSNLIGTILVS